MVPDAVLMDTQEELTDLLDRKAFVARLIDVVEILSENRKNASFAVNGAWGVGKTFVLNRFEEEIAKYPLEEDGPRKYLVFHYDCWKYDYYEEPLIALVAALTDSIDKQTNFISADKRTTFKVVLKEIIAGLVEVGSVKTGFDIKKIFETIKSARNKATQEIADSHDFDVYFSFNCILEKLRAAIKDLAEEQTILSREEDKSDAVFACIGMFLTVLKFYELDVKKAKEDFQIRTLFEPLSTYHDKRGGAIPMGLAHLREKYTPDTSEEDLSPTGTKYMHHMRRAETQMRVDCPDIWGILLASYRAILGFEGDLWYKGSRIDLYIKPFVLRYWKLLETIA